MTIHSPGRALRAAAALRLPQPIAFMLRHGALGLAVGTAAGCTLILANIGGLSSLMARSPQGDLAGLFLVAALAGTAASTQIAFAIGLLAQAPAAPGDRGRPRRADIVTAIAPVATR